MSNEATLKYPIADLLTSKRFQIDMIKLEHSHPQYFDRTIDLVILDTARQITGAFEFKLAKATTNGDPEKQRIFNDIARMYAVAKVQQCPAFVLIAGKEADFIQKFRSITGAKAGKGQNTTIPAPQGFYTEWFDFVKDGVKSFSLTSALSSEYANIYQKFDKDYVQRLQVSPLVLPAKIQTRCLAISAFSRANPTPFVAGLWQIQEDGGFAVNDVSI